MYLLSLDFDRHYCIFCRLTWRLYCSAMHLLFNSPYCRKFLFKLPSNIIFAYFRRIKERIYCTMEIEYGHICVWPSISWPLPIANSSVHARQGWNTCSCSLNSGNLSSSFWEIPFLVNPQSTRMQLCYTFGQDSCTIDQDKFLWWRFLYRSEFGNALRIFIM